MDYDHAKYVGDIPEYRDQLAYVRPHLPTLELPLAYRKVHVKWFEPKLIHHENGKEVGNRWHLMPAKDFRILVPVKV